MKEIKLSNPLTWEDVAKEYKKLTNRTAYIRPMEDVFRYLEERVDLFHVDPKEGTIHKILK